MYTRWLYTHINNPIKNIEIRRYNCAHYYVREYLTSPTGKYVLDVFPFRRIKKSELIELIEHYMLFDCDVIERIKQ